MPDTTSADLVAAVFDSKQAAVKARAALEKADRDMEVVHLNRIAIIEKGKDGKLTFSEADKGKGGVWSLAQSAAFAVGAALGKGATLLPDKWAEDTAALAARLKDSGFPDEALAEIGAGLEEGVAVLLTLVDSDDEQAFVSRSLAEHGGKLIHTTLSKGVADHLSQATPTGKAAGSVSGLAAGAAAVVAGTKGAATGAARKVKVVDGGNLVDSAKGATAAAAGAAKSATTAAAGAAKSATAAAAGAAKKVTQAVDVDTAKGLATVATGAAKEAVKNPVETAKDLTALAKSQTKKLTGKGAERAADPTQGDQVKKTVKAATATIPVTGKAAAPTEEATPAAEPSPAASQAAPAEAPAAATVKRATAKKKAAPPDDLQRLPDVGPVYERLLQANGVTTYAQVARLSSDRLRAMFSGADPETGLPVMEISAEQAKAIKAAAKELAAAKA